MVVGVKYRGCSRNLIAVALMVSSFWDLLGNAGVGGGFIVVYEKLFFSKHGSSIFWIGKSVRGI